MQEKNNSDIHSENGSVASDSRVSFVLEENGESSGLVFEDLSERKEQSSSAEPRLKFEAVDDSENESETVDEKEPEKKSAPEALTFINGTYVPRFTGASDNFRMADIPPQNRVSADVNRTDSEVSSTESDRIDPTAEIYGEKSSGAIAVKVGKERTEDFESSSRVFKFVKNELPREAVREPQAAIEETVIVESVEADEPPVTENKTSPTEYRIPDPEDSVTEVVNYVPRNALLAERIVEDAPRGIGNPIDNGARSKEYTSYLQRDSFKDRFIDKRMSICVRLFASLLLMIMLVASETMFAMGVNIPARMNLSDIPGAMALLDFQFVLCLYLLAIPETARAIKLLFKKQVTSDLFLTVQLIVLASYTVLMVIHSPKNYALFGLIFAISTIGTVLSSYFKENADFKSFLRISQNSDKTVIDNKPTRMLERENAALDGVVKEHKSKIARVFKSTFVSDFFRRSEKSAEKSVNIISIIAVALGFGIVLGTVAFFVAGGAISAITAFVAVTMLMCPVLSVLMHKMVFYHAECAADRDGNAVIGEKSLADYSGVDVIAFDDTEVFGDEDVSLQRIMLYGNSDNLSKALRQMSALFMNVGGPLSVMFSDSLDRKCSPADFTCVENGGIRGEIDGHQILAGTLEYMTCKGAVIPKSENGAPESGHDSTKVMYAAEDGVVYAKFYVRYSFSEEFSMLLPILEDYGITPLVYTRDPNITPELISTLTAGNDKIRILKKNDTAQGDNVVYRSVSAGIVSTAGKNEVVNAVLVSKKYSALMSLFSKLEIAAMVIGGAYATVVSLGRFFSIPSFVPAIWHAALCATAFIISKITFRAQGK